MSRNRPWDLSPRSCWVFLLAVVLHATQPDGAVGHEDAVLTASHSAVVAGDSLQILGSEFVPGKEYELRLVGPLRDYSLRFVRADSAGRFSEEVEIPREVLPGYYRVAAKAEDGDVVARVDVTVTTTARVNTNGALSSIPDAAPSPGTSGIRGAYVAHAGHLDIERTRSWIEWAVIGLLVGGSTFLGPWLLIRAGISPD